MSLHIVVSVSESMGVVLMWVEQYMSVVVREGQDKSRIYSKGSFERVSKMCVGVEGWMERKSREYASEGYYVIAVASREVSKGEMSRQEMEQGMRLEGVLLFRNELKVDTRESVDKLKEGGSQVVMITGDNAQTAVSVGKRSGIVCESSQVLLGEVGEDGRVMLI